MSKCEFTESDQPKQGDEILVWDGTCPLAPRLRFFVAFLDDRVLTRKGLSYCITTWQNWKWPEEKKPVAREGWIHPDALAPMRGYSGFIKVREVLEDE